MGGAVSSGLLLPSQTHALSSNTATKGSTPRDFVLVHGAWHGGWCWRLVADRLRAMGHRVFTPTMTGLGERAHLLSADISLETHIQDVLGVIEAEELDGFTLMVHSYGGMIITGVADTLRERLAHVSYLDAVFPRDGRSMIETRDYDTSAAAEAAREAVRNMSKDGISLNSPPPGVFGIPSEDEELTDWAARRLTPHPMQTWLDSIELKNGGSDGLSRSYIHCNQPALQQSSFPDNYLKFRDDPTWVTVKTLPTGHNAMMTMPDAVVDLLLEVSA